MWIIFNVVLVIGVFFSIMYAIKAIKANTRKRLEIRLIEIPKGYFGIQRNEQRAQYEVWVKPMMFQYTLLDRNHNIAGFKTIEEAEYFIKELLWAKQNIPFDMLYRNNASYFRYYPNATKDILL